MISKTISTQQSVNYTELRGTASRTEI